MEAKRSKVFCRRIKGRAAWASLKSGVTVWLDGFGAGSDRICRSIRDSCGGLQSCFIDTDVFKKMNDQGEGTHGVDNDFAAQSMDNMGGWIFGRNMLRPVRGPWKDESWKG